MKPFVTALSAQEEKPGLVGMGEGRVFCPCDEAFYYCCLSAGAHTIQGGEAGLRGPSEETLQPPAEARAGAAAASSLGGLGQLHHSAEQLPCLLPLLKGKPPHTQRRAAEESFPQLIRERHCYRGRKEQGVEQGQRRRQAAQEQRGAYPELSKAQGWKVETALSPSGAHSAAHPGPKLSLVG